jgi:hypothetical protein
MPRIFLSYRRDDSRKDTGRIYDRMVQAFSKANVFKDVDNIAPGADFRGVLKEAVSQADVALIIIGPKWLAITDGAGNRRLDDSGDFVRIEVESALQRESCLTIPVLVDGAKMPNASDLPESLRELAYKNAVVVRDDPDFNTDITRLVNSIPTSLAQPAAPRQQANKRGGLPTGLIGLGATILIGAVLVVTVLLPALNNQRTANVTTETPTTTLTLAPTTAIPAATMTPTLTETLTPQPPTATDTATATQTPSYTPTSTPVPPNATTPLPSPSAVVPTLATPAATVAPTIATPQAVVTRVFPCSAVIVNPDSKATVITAIYTDAAATTTSNASVRVGESITVQRRGNEAGSLNMYLIYRESQRLGWMSSRFLTLAENCPL